MAYFLGMDIGGTKISAAVFDEKGESFVKKKMDIQRREGKEVGKLIRELIGALMKQNTENHRQISAIGVCIPGIYYSKTGHVWAPNINGWKNYPLMQEIRSMPEAEKLPIAIDSDRACYILGETWLGAAKGCGNAIFLAVGTGIGAGILIDGQILRGANNIAGAIGWLALQRPFEDKYISCGCFEYQASGEGLARMVREYICDNPEFTGPLKHLPKAAITSPNIFDALNKNDTVAEKVIENAIQLWGMAAANLVSLFNPEKIIFGGGVFGPASKYLDQIYEEARKWAQPISINHVTFEASALGSDAGLIGAGHLAALAMQV